MTSQEMYREHILDLYKNPHNFGEIKNCTHSHKEFNPFCGDEITIYLILKDNKIEDVKFKAGGCAISIASASLLTDKIKGMKLNEIENIKSNNVIEMLNIPISPVRMKCALLPMDALNGAIKC